MAQLIRVPRRVAPTNTERVALVWQVMPGDLVTAGATIARVGCEGEACDCVALEAGFLRARYVSDGAKVLPGQPIALLTERPDGEIAALERGGRRALARFFRQQDETRRRKEQQGARSPAPEPGGDCITSLYQQWTARTPDAVAIVFGRGCLTYAALDRRAGRVAHFLREAGVVAETAVGVCLPRSLEQIPVLLGILKAGGVYLSLDAAYPAERLGYMLEDARPLLVLTGQAHLTLFERLGASAVDAAAMLEDPSPPEDHSPTPANVPENLAYIIYTSGSTGLAKGVTTPHRGVERLVRDNNFLDPGPHKTFLQFAPLTFDASTLEIWGCLLNGARLEIFPEEGVSLERLGAFVKRRRVTTLWLTAGLFHQMVDTRLRDFEYVHELLAGGDVLAPARVERVLRELPGCVLINGYGPTENTTFTTCHRMEEPGLSGDSVPIGRSLRRGSVFLLDGRLNSAPEGEPAQLSAGGDGLARGYLNRPELTAEKFIPNPRADRPGDRLYQTGDLARVLEDGSLTFLGRRDFQVKIRGFRIEPGEIETMLDRHPAVAGAVVLARTDNCGEKRLVAYVACREPENAAADQNPGPRELRTFLRRHLPDHMIPSAFVMLDRLPLNANGKVDRRALPAPELSREHLEVAFVAARSELEKGLGAIWSEVLGIREIGVHDNFLALGGHSLLATRVLSRVRAVLNRELPFQVFFAGPTIAEIATYLGAPEAVGSTRPVPAMVPVERKRRLPLSFAQQRLWFIDRIDPGGTAYNITFAYRLEGPLNAGLLERALNEVVHRQESTRTVFREIEGTPSQVVEAFRYCPLRVEDWAALDREKHVHAAKQRAATEASRPFSLDEAPLHRELLLHLGKAHHVLILTMHHIISDGWSMGIMLEELFSGYTALLEDRPPCLAELPVQYVDFTLWQRRWLQGPVLESRVAYWKGQLGGDLPLSELPTDRPRPRRQRFLGALSFFKIDENRGNALKELAREWDATLFMVLLSAFKLLLHRYSGQSDIVVGSPIANRTRIEIERLIGFFVNTLVLRSNLYDNPTFSGLLQRVKKTTLQAYTHQDLPFEKLVEVLKPPRALSHNPMFQVMFVLQNTPLMAYPQPGLRMTSLDFERGMAHFDLTLNMEEVGEGLACHFEYDRDLFERATIERMRDHFLHLLEDLAREPSARCSELRLLSDRELRQLTLAWNATEVEFPRARPVYRLFESWAARTPEAPAAMAGGQESGRRTLSYARLNRRANRLAMYLRERGVGPDVLVGIFMEREVEVAVAVLGLLKAGGAYLPLDPAYPEERTRFVLEDAGPGLVLVQERFSRRPELAGIPSLALDAERAELSSLADENHGESPLEDHLAYVIYTSGSTGRPKGTLITHRGLSNYLAWAARAYQADKGAGAPIHSSLAFDLTVTSLFLPLISGKTAYFLAEAAGVETLRHALDHGEELSLVKLTPAHLQLLSQSMTPAGMNRRTRFFVIGGEVPPAETVRLWRRHAPSTVLVNEYGPTETVVGCCAFFIRGNPPESERVPIGRPIANTALFVLDAHLRPVPVGVTGELWIGGHGLARGYLQRPGLSATRFLPRPFTCRPGERIYRSGDLARYLPDGKLVFLGRTDHQVKLRGYRIELEEIETTLLESGQLETALVLVREDQPGDRRLVAYVQPAEPNTVAAGQLPGFLHETLAARLPEYMLPVAYMVLDGFPLTVNGKIDKRALPAPEPSRSMAEGSYQEPRNRVERMLVEIWTEVLGIAAVGIFDDFFQLGGHSLLITRVVAGIEDKLGVRMPVGAVFENKTVALQADAVYDGLLEIARGTVPVAEGAAIQAVPRTGYPPLSSGQRRLWLMEEMDPGKAIYLIPLAIRFGRRVGWLPLEQAIRALGQRHESLRTLFPSREGTPIQSIRAFQPSSMAMIDLSGLPVDQRQPLSRQLTAHEGGLPFDLSRGPLTRAHLLRLGGNDDLFLWTMHHIIGDGWSNGILMRELRLAYQAFLAGTQPQWQPLPFQYADFAIWQQGHLASPRISRQLGYWRNLLGGELPVLELLTDRPRPGTRRFRGAMLPVTLPDSLAGDVGVLGRARGLTLFSTLLTAFNILLARYSGQGDILLGVPFANRNQRGLDRLIGFFVNTLVLRTRIAAGSNVGSLLQGVQKRVLEADANQDVPFDLLVETLGVERDPSRNPIFQVMFAFQDLSGEEREAERDWQPYYVDRGLTHFDLTLNLERRGDSSKSAACIAGELEYDSDLFDGATIARMKTHFLRILAAMTTNQRQDPLRIDMLDAGERRLLLESWNAPREAPAKGARGFPELMEPWAKRTPDAMALVFQGDTGPDRCLTYATLRKSIQRLAAILRARGLRRETPVAVLMPRTLEVVLSFAAILRAGGVYIPIDPGYPAKRHDYMLENSGARLVLLPRDAEDGRMPSPNPGVIPLPFPDLGGEEGRKTRGGRDGKPLVENTAYVIYTSGSTGKPKGVAVTHAGLGNLARAQAGDFAIGPGVRVLQFASFCFDASIAEMVGSLGNGATLVLAHGDLLMPGPELSGTLRRQFIGEVLLPPSALSAMTGKSFPHLATLVVGGEACPAEVANRWSPGRRFFNAYGPTEATVAVTTMACQPARNAPAIGRPFAGARIFLLDRAMEAVPIGVAGELFIGSPGLARSYVGRPDLTAGRFVPDPFAPDPGGRLYRSGDLSRYRADARIEYLGRVDHQVKLRGFRIEPGEIETVLESHGEILQAVVLVRETTAGQKSLVAYLLAEHPAGPGTTTPRTHLEDRLPRHMIPSFFLWLEAFPLTSNGKIDRAALNRLPLDPPTETEPGEPRNDGPRGALETTLAAIWRELLPVKRIREQDNFFHLGGHSLLATQVISRLRERLGVSLPMRALFEHPTLAGLAERVVHHLIRRPRGAETTPATAPLATTRSQCAERVLSFAQQRLWFVFRMDPQNPVYNISLAFQLRGPLATAALEAGLATIIERHEALRTCFPAREGKPVQRIEPAAAVARIALIDPRGGMERKLVQGLARLEARQPFDLSCLPLFRFTLLREASSSHVLLLTMHHIISDGWSMGIFARELAAGYAIHLWGRTDNRPPLPLQYVDFAAWQRDRPRAAELERQLAYWRNRLAPPLVSLDLPTDRPRPTIQSFQGDSVAIETDADLSRRIKLLRDRTGVTLFEILLAAFKLLLYRYSGQSMLLVGVPIANRNRTEIENLIGFFVNSLVFKTELDDRLCFAEWVDRVRQANLEAQDHQDLPFEMLVQEIQPQRDLGRNPIFQVCFAFQNLPKSALALDGMRAEPIKINTGLAHFDLTLGLAETEGEAGLRGDLDFNSALFKRATILRMRRHYLALLSRAVDEPHKPLADLELMSVQERERVLYDWNKTRTDYPERMGIVEIFTNRATSRPDATAMVYEVEGGRERFFSYAALDEASDKLARGLLGIGIRCESLVGVCAGRSPEMVLALLAILKAGGAYIPLDADSPADRLRYMIEDAAMSAVLTLAPSGAGFPETTAPAHRIADLSRSRGAEGTPLPRPGCAEQLAYVMYTSGSTGRPKGSAIPQRAIQRLVFNTNFLRLGPEDRLGQVANPVFDAATLEIWGALLPGGQVVGIAKEVALSAYRLARRLGGRYLTALFLTTSLFNRHVDERPRMFEGFPNLLFGGEAADPKSVARLWKMGRPRVLINAYGPTESTTFASWFPIAKAPRVDEKLPIGKPLANTTLYVLDRHARPVPVGVPGELFIGGDGLARGYHRGPALSAEKFVPDAIGRSGGRRLYRSGDLVKRLESGDILFLGRLDHQIKLRGFRIEPGEIEAVLHTHPQVHRALLTTARDERGQVFLAAYIQPEPGAPGKLDARDLRGFTRDRLPHYMIPSAFILLERFPLTPNGKVDRRALPEPTHGLQVSAGERVAPRNEVEAALAGFWTELLRVDGVSVTDNFFELGGHSLLVTQLVSRIKAQFQVALSLRSLFERPTIAELAEVIASSRGRDGGREALIIATADRALPLPLSFSQRRLWFFDRMNPGHMPYNIPLALRLHGPLDLRALAAGLDRIVERHQSLRATFQPDEGEAVQVIGPAFPMKPVLVSLQSLPRKERERIIADLVNQEGGRVFDLLKGPLLRLTLCRATHEEHVLLLTMHHIVSDGWSLQVLSRELDIFYREACLGTPVRLSPLPIQYVDYASWQRNRLEGETPVGALAFWREKLAGKLPPMATDRPRRQNPDFRGGMLEVRVSRERTNRLQALCLQENTTLFMALLAAYQVALTRYCGVSELAIGTAVANRTRAETEPLIGLFVNTLVLRTDLSGNPSLREILGRVRQTTIEAFAHQDFPFDKLVEELKPKRVAGMNPIFQAMFSFQSEPMTAMTLVGTKAETLTADIGVTLFEMTLALQRTEAGLDGVITYRAELFFEQTIGEVMQDFQALLDAMASRPQARPGDVPRPAARSLPAKAERESLASHPAVENDDFLQSSMPIGSPLENMRIILADPNLYLVPEGFPGEPCIGGEGLARGYLGKPELTARKFVPDPFSQIPGDRLYRSGDLANYARAGYLDYLGRVDQQVKIRGFRIELGEIESALGGHEAVSQTIVIMREDRPGARRLVAYVQPTDVRLAEPAHKDEPALLAEIRSFLSEILPDYMVPAAFVLLAGFPLTPNGKIDRRALPEPTDASEHAGCDSPRDRLELQLLGIWEEVLGSGPLGVSDNFFESGGHSLLALRLMARLEKEAGISLPVAALFQAPTIEKMAALLHHSGGKVAPSPLVELKGSGSHPPLFLVHAVGGSATRFVELARHLDRQQPLFGFEAPGLDDDRPPLTQIEDLAALYLELMVAKQPRGPYYLGGWSLGGTVALEMAQRLRATNRRVALLVMLDSWSLIRETGYQETEIAFSFADDLFAGLVNGDQTRAEIQEHGVDPLAWVVAKARELQILGPSTDGERVGRLYRVFRANMQAAGKYSPKAYAGETLLLRAAEGPGSLEPDQPARGWVERGIPVRVIDTPGNHHGMLSEPHVRRLAASLTEQLERVRTATARPARPPEVYPP